MAIIPSDTRFIGISPGVNLVEKKSNQLNAETQPYTMQDIIDTAGGNDGSLQIEGSVTIDSTLRYVVDKDGTRSPLMLSTGSVSNFGTAGWDTNAAFGKDALINANSSDYNTAIGYSALKANQDFGCTAVGAEALLNSRYSSYSTAVGAWALNAQTDGQIPLSCCKS